MIIQQCQTTTTLCLNALHHATFSKEMEITQQQQQQHHRQMNVTVVCQVLLRLFDNVVVATTATTNKGGGGGQEVSVNGIVRNALHEAVLMILRGICYDNVVQEDNTTTPPLLTLESLRPITGMILPKLYPDNSVVVEDNNDTAPAADERAMELWKEILLLLSPNLEDVQEEEVKGRYGGDGKRRRCKNCKKSIHVDMSKKNHVAPMTATAMLCIVLPTFRKMELPMVIDTNNTNSFSCCRPIFQPSVWKLIRGCLARRGDSDNSAAGSGGRGTSLLSRGGGGGGAARDGFESSNDHHHLSDHDRASMDQLLRRRSAHALRLMVEYERERCLRGGGGGSRNVKKGRMQQNRGNNASSSPGINGDYRRQVDLWMKYVLCFEMLEMETVLHLVEQVWDTVKEMASEVVAVDDVASDDAGKEEETTSSQQLLPKLLWDDVGSLLCRVLLSDAPTLRKLGLYRFLSGHAGVEVAAAVPQAKSSSANTNTMSDDEKTNNGSVYMKQPKSNGKIKKKTGSSTSQPAPLSVVSVAFVLDVVMQSYDSILGTKVGSNMQIDEGGKQTSVSIPDLLRPFLENYTLTLASNSGDDIVKVGSSSRLSEFVNKVFGPDVIQSHKSRTLVLLYQSVANALETRNVDPAIDEKSMLYIDPENVQATIRSIRALFSSGGAPKSVQEGLKLDLALVLKNSMPWEKVDAAVVLQLLALYPPPPPSTEESPIDETEESTQSKARDAIGEWLLGLGGGKWAKNAASACASAFVLGHLLPFGEMDIMSGVNTAERETGMAIGILCSLSGGSELLWPSVFKGLQNVPTTASSTPGFCKANRSMILLEFGCKEGILSGMGNGDLLLDSKQYMMPPPPHVESLLGNAVQFLLSQLMSMSTTLFETSKGSESSGSTRSSTSGSASSYIAILIGQLRVLYLAYPSSDTLSQAVNSMLGECVSFLAKLDTNNSSSENAIRIVKYLTLTYAALSCGAAFTGGDTMNQLISTCHTILGLDFSIPSGVKKEAKQACRGSLSLIAPKITEEAGTHSDPEIEDVYQAILNSARESVDATPVIALPPLFECALGAGKHIVKFDGQKSPLLSSLQTIIETLFAVLEEETSSSNWSYSLNEMCKLIFRGKLLLVEYKSSCSDGSRGPMPIKQAFEKLLKIGGATKPHIFKTVVSRISVAWLGPEHAGSDGGLCAIPYRDHIVDLIVYKECRFDEGAAHQTSKEKWNALPDATDSSSITRAFVLLFLSKLPSPENMSDVVLKELIHYVMMKLIDICCAKPAKGKIFISGSDEYSRYTRAFQALCLLSRFVTEDIAKDVALRVFPSMAYNLQGQLRYFIEVFTIQCTRRHPSVFGQMYIQEIRKTDLSLQHVSSLMIIGGNLTVGRYSNDFFHSSADHRIKDVLCGALPWLSSTQGFSRAIAQLLCHKLIPLVVDVNATASSGGQEKDDAVLRSLYSFLQDNTDMSRLRVKQQLFFDTYDVDTACSFEGLLSIPVDEGEEANPVHMVDAIKDCLADVYKEAHDEDAPIWKQMEDLLIDADRVNQPEDSNNDSGDVQDETELVNFQRKILPIDALDLGIQSFQEQKLFNAAGKKKQSLIVCASLIDKVPNLAGLARTCEIFSAQTLVIPNLIVRKQDDFKSISASANDWVDMEECKEDALLSWLYTKKSEGYAIIGLEQTASSKCLTTMKFPNKTVLLLGKEKEGIPIEFLSAVDQCIEIPQLGIIRSLNVHVSGAISIWEYTKQMMQKGRTG
ncbi:hypothetical protein ACHAXR_011688 [Thalassiosira sp. AJA248-18]